MREHLETALLIAASIVGLAAPFWLVITINHSLFPNG